MSLMGFFKRGCSAADMQQQAERDAAKSAQADAVAMQSSCSLLKS
jgi:hypothetical protein